MFKKGQKVKCLKTYNGMFGERQFTEGKIYIIRADDFTCVLVKEDDTGHSNWAPGSWFELIKKSSKSPSWL